MNVHLGWHFLYARQFDQALDQHRKAVEADPNYGLPCWYSGLAYEQRAKELRPEDSVIVSGIGHLDAVRGRRREAEAILAQLERKRTRSYVSSFELALIHAGLGEKTKALAEIEQAYQERSDMLVYLGVDPRLDGLRSEPRFPAIPQRMANSLLMAWSRIGVGPGLTYGSRNISPHTASQSASG